MMQIECPWCGRRDEEEFTCGGEAHIQRPPDPQQNSDAEWAAYLFDRINPKGVHLERWCHTYGCRQWFNVARHTVNHNILAVYRMGAAVPADSVGVAVDEVSA
ncbi:sarcosine oxidase subunit delta [Exilibacterium tricleocarpae]|uniref:Sarcosine oxidase subunit delta n=1 Tax=Exilibacterium tricleocarpae TaxID=2591008 RepID=A0A545SZW1_9GAMM|nr:sarcosine oxidase subunit delta [Exilibacterium tricleocarpae]TQV70516.1 sarcosine oxidase subunit delta [Exilibacterium tricleocarpae]